MRKGAKGEGLTFYGPEEALIAYNEETKGFYVCGQTEFSDLIDTCFNDEEYTKILICIVL